MKLSRVFLLFLLCLCTSIVGFAQDQSAKRRVSVTLKNQDPITGYLIRSDADVIVIDNEDGTFQRVPLDSVTMIFFAQERAASDSIPAQSDVPISSVTESRSTTLRTQVRGLELKKARLIASTQQLDLDLQKLEDEIVAANAEPERLSQLPAEEPQPARVEASTPQSVNSSGTVNVRGYYRKDGTYVRPHTRSAPRRKN